jgi:hypothetical protein
MLLALSGDELLSAVDVTGCTREDSIGHDVYSERGHVGRPDDAADGKRGTKLIATFTGSLPFSEAGCRRDRYF